MDLPVKKLDVVARCEQLLASPYLNPKLRAALRRYMAQADTREPARYLTRQVEGLARVTSGCGIFGDGDLAGTKAGRRKAGR